MTQETINIGTVPNDGTGDPIRESFNKTNTNFNEIYATGMVDGTLLIGAGGDLNEISTSETDASITVKANGTGIIVFDTDTINITTLRTVADIVNGASGDTAGDVCWDNDYIYICITTFGGATPIWKRVQIGGTLVIGDATDTNRVTSSDANGDITITPTGTGTAIFDNDSFRITSSRTVADLLNGTAGDTAGDICWDVDNLYICINTHGTITPVWKKIPAVDTLTLGDGVNSNTITTLNSDTSITIKPTGTGNVILNTDTMGITDSRLPDNSGKGITGDTAGDMCWDTSNLYVCTADWVDGVAVIWKKVPLNAF